MSVSLLQGITKDWEHADFDLVRKSANTLPEEKLNTEFCIFEYEIVIPQGVITEQDTYGLGFVIDFSVECDVGVKVRAVADGLKYKSVTPDFPMNLKSTRYGKPKPKSVPCPLRETDVLVAVGDCEIADGENESTLLKKIMFEKFKMSRTDPGNQGCVKCRFGRVLTYQDALEQFEVLVRLPILLIGVTPQDLLELTDITSLRQQVSPMSTPDRKKASMGPTGTFAYKSPHRLASPTSTPERQKGISMDLRDRLTPGERGGRLNESSFAGKSNLDMRSRFAAQAAEKHETKVTPNRSVHTVSARSRIEASPARDALPPATSADLLDEETPGPAMKGLPELPSRAQADLAAAAAAVRASKSTDESSKPSNPFFIPSPSQEARVTKAQSPNSVAPVAKKLSPPRSAPVAGASDVHAAPKSVIQDDSSSVGGVVKILIVALVLGIVIFVASTFSVTAVPEMRPAFTDKPVSVFHTTRVFADATKEYAGILTPDIIIGHR